MIAFALTACAISDMIKIILFILMKNTNKYKYQRNKVIFNSYGIKKVRVPKVNPHFLVWSPIICCLVAIKIKSVISKSIIICNIL